MCCISDFVSDEVHYSYRIAYGSGFFAAIPSQSSSAPVLISSDGINFNYATKSRRFPVFGTHLTFSNSAFLAAGGSSRAFVATDPHSWEPITLPIEAESVNVINNKFIISGIDSTGKPAIFESGDGMS